MNCQDVRPRLLDFGRGHLGAEARAEVRAHLDGCAACAAEETAERALSEALEERLPRYKAPVGLKRRLAREWTGAAPAPPWWRRWARPLVPTFALAAALLIGLPLYYQHQWSGSRDGAPMITEAVNDHLRVLSSQHPLDIESGGMHQVKPWFEGRLDFAPVVPFVGDADFPLQGGAVGYFVDRRAAVFVFRRRLHVISLFVFRAEGLPWPSHRGERLGRSEAWPTSSRGFNVILWRSGELGYALVSDVDRQELGQLAVKLAPA
ncbi:MAG TPA: zf-HC2 domain-containing protein [Candidatus Methylomirabilis sp.]|nr:zf-HC2 domain-containing protein [Candidatus Methylomirabilis sp.]